MHCAQYCLLNRDLTGTSSLLHPAASFTLMLWSSFKVLSISTGCQRWRTSCQDNRQLQGQWPVSRPGCQDPRRTERRHLFIQHQRWCCWMWAAVQQVGPPFTLVLPLCSLKQYFQILLPQVQELHQWLQWRVQGWTSTPALPAVCALVPGNVMLWSQDSRYTLPSLIFVCAAFIDSEPLPVAHKFFSQHVALFKDMAENQGMLEILQNMFSKQDVLASKPLVEFRCGHQGESSGLKFPESVIYFCSFFILYYHRQHKFVVYISEEAIEYLYRYLKVFCS